MQNRINRLQDTFRSAELPTLRSIARLVLFARAWRGRWLNYLMVTWFDAKPDVNSGCDVLHGGFCHFLFFLIDFNPIFHHCATYEIPDHHRELQGSDQSRCCFPLPKSGTNIYVPRCPSTPFILSAVNPKQLALWTP